MEPDPLSWESILLRFGAVLVLILINGFFVAVEFALVATRQSRLRQRAAEGNRLAKIAEKLRHNLDATIAAAQLGITMASLLVGWIGETTLAVIFLPFFDFLPPRAALITSHSLASACAFALITLMHVVFGEQIPKSVAIVYPTRTAMYLSYVMQVCMMLLKPFVWILTGVTNLGLRILRIPSPKGHQTVHSAEELKFIIEASHQGGVIDALEKDLLHKIFKFGDLVARQVMVPRTEISFIPVNATLQGVVEISSKTGHTRFPIFEKDIDNIVGILHMKDIVHFSQTGKPFQLTKIMKEVHFIPEAMPVVQVLSFLKQKHTQMVIVVDEFGGTSGLVTLEDVIEEIIGDFYDEHHPAIHEIIQLSENEVLLQARVRLDEINERFGLNLQSEDADTIGGFVLQELGAIPHTGDTIEVPGAWIKVEEMSRWKIKKVRLILQPQPVEKD